jgi:hypothetical protein
VLSRTWGNYPGLFAYDVRRATPNQHWGLKLPEQIPGSSGDLPNDRRHVLRAWAAHQLGAAWSAGALVLVASGTPLSELGAHPVFGTFFPVYLRSRGSAGRTPWIWDASVRVSWQLPGPGPRVTLDVLHVGNPQIVTDREQFRFLGVDSGGNQTLPNANYRTPLAFTQPMTIRLGISGTW